MDAKDTEIQRLKNEAIKYYQKKKYNVSLQLWYKLLKLDPKHALAKLYIRRIQHAASSKKSEGKKEAPSKKHVSEKVKVMVVDDSSMMRKAIMRILSKHDNIEAVGVGGGEEALKRIPRENPDVISLDVNMPGMDGITTLKHIMVQFPRPVIMLSAFTEEGATATFDCMFYGAIDFVAKPNRGMDGLKQQQEQLKEKILNASRVQVSSPKKSRVVKKTVLALKETAKRKIARWVVAIGGGDGCYNAYLKILPQLPAKLPCAILAIQHTKEEYLQPFCDYLNHSSRILVKKARQGEPIKEGVCYFTHDGNYLKIERSSEGPFCQITPKPSVIAQQNVVNQLFFSTSEKYGAQSMGILLTGGGIDGIEGLRELKRMRAITIVQDPRTCLLPHTVNAAIKGKCVDQVVMDSDIAAMVWYLLKTRARH